MTSFSVVNLRAVLVTDAIVCLVFGGIFAVLGADVARLLTRDVETVAGISLPVTVRALGVAVILVGVGVGVVARRRPIPHAGVLPILAIEVLWVLACIALLAGAPDRLTAWGVVVTVVGAVTVAVFFVLEVAGLRREASQPPSTRLNTDGAKGRPSGRFVTATGG